MRESRVQARQAGAEAVQAEQEESQIQVEPERVVPRGQVRQEAELQVAQAEGQVRQAEVER